MRGIMKALTTTIYAVSLYGVTINYFNMKTINFMKSDKRYSIICS